MAYHNFYNRVISVMVLSLLVPGIVRAESFDQMGSYLSAGMNRNWQIHGYQRIRSSGYYNLDLDRGLTPSGTPTFPVPLSEGQWLSSSDMRFRTDISGVSERGSVGVHVRMDVFDNMRLGSLPQGTAIDSTSQTAPSDSIVVRQAYATALTPVGFVIAGRMSNTWGLGMLANSGECVDCNSVDVSDRVAFVTSLVGHLWVAAYDFSSTGLGTSRAYNVPDIDLEPTDNAGSITFAVMNVLSDYTRDRRQRAGKTSVEYGLYWSQRNQQNDIPSAYVGNASTNDITQTSLVARNYRANAVDGYYRITAPKMHIASEFAYLQAYIGDPMIFSGLSSQDSLTSSQWGMAIESSFGDPKATVQWGLDAGIASGDSAPGFGARPSASYQPTISGDLDGPQFSLPNDTNVNNFKFHSDYRIDKILWREIIGTVTDAVYIKPHASWQLAKAGPGTLSLHQSLVWSRAMEASSTLSGAKSLGVEWDPTLEYISTDGMGFQIDYALLLPMAGLDNPVAGLEAKPAQLIRTHLRYKF